MNKIDYDILVHKRLTGDISGEEMSILQDWLLSDPKNQESAKQLAQLWNEPWNELLYNIPDKNHKESQRKKLLETIKNYNVLERHARKYKVYRQMTAAAILILCPLLLAYWKLNQPLNSTADRKQTLWLMDSSHITLNKNAAIAFLPSIKNFSVKFQGDAYFDMTKNAQIVVNLKEGTIKASSASFFVTENQLGHTEVSVVSGSLIVSSGNQSIQLSANQGCNILPKAGIQVRSYPVNSNTLSWYTGVWSFQNTNLLEITSLISEEYNTSIRIQDKTLLKTTFTGTFVHEKLENLLAQLSVSMGFAYKLSNGIYHINTLPVTN